MIIKNFYGGELSACRRFFMLLCISRFPYPIYATLCPSKKARRLIKAPFVLPPPFDPRATAQVKRMTLCPSKKARRLIKAPFVLPPPFDPRATAQVKRIRKHGRAEQKTAFAAGADKQAARRAKNRRRGRFYPLLRRRHMRREGGRTEKHKKGAAVKAFDFCRRTFKLFALTPLFRHSRFI